MSNPNRINGNQLLIEDRPFFLRGGELHYFRMPMDTWRNRLEKARDCGMNTVSSYMPWYWHEPEEGTVDLTGQTRPELNLKLFLDLAAELDLRVVARPGPFVNSELRYGGFPGWLFRDHPETMSRRADGTPGTGRPCPAEGEPVYRAYVRKWFQAVVPLIAQYQIDRGGPVILFQPDNELSAAWSYGLTNSLYDPTVLAETWPAWLKRTYGSLEALNERYGASYVALDEVDAPRAFPTTPEDKLRCLDWLNFKRWFFADWGATLAAWAREDGITVPIIFNEPVAGFYNHGDHAGFGAVAKERGLEGATCCHVYSDRIIDLEASVGSALGVELVKSSPWGGPPMAVEVNTNWHIPRLCRSPINWEPLLRLGLGRGLLGTVVYPFAAAWGPLEDTIDGPEYWNPTCLDLEGRPVQGFYHLQRFYRFVRAWEAEIATSEMVADVTIAYTPGQRLLDFLGVPSLMAQQVSGTAGPGGERFTAEPSLQQAVDTGHEWVGGVEGVTKQATPPEAGLWKKTTEAALLCTRLNLGFNLLELTNPNRKPGQGWILIPCTGSLEREALDYLLAHLEAGGGCLFFPTIPVQDSDGNPDLRLAERLGVRLRQQIRGAGGELMDYGTRVVDYANGKQVGLNGWLWVHDFPEGSEELASFEGRPLAARLPAARGQALVAGLDMSFTTLSSLDLWQNLWAAAGLEPAIRTEGNWYHALLKRGPQAGLLSIANLTGYTGPCTFRLAHPEPELDEVTLTVELSPHEARCLLIGLPIPGYRLLYATSEIIPCEDAPQKWELHGQSGTPGELCFAAPTSGRLNGQPVASEETGEGHVLAYRHQDQPLFFEMNR